MDTFSCYTTYSHDTIEKYKEAMNILVQQDLEGVLHDSIVGVYNLLDKLQREEVIYSQFEHIDCVCGICRITAQFS